MEVHRSLVLCLGAGGVFGIPVDDDLNDRCNMIGAEAPTQTHREHSQGKQEW